MDSDRLDGVLRGGTWISYRSLLGLGWSFEISGEDVESDMLFTKLLDILGDRTRRKRGLRDEFGNLIPTYLFQ